MKSIDLSTDPTFPFSIVQPPRFKKLEEFKGAVVGLSFFFGVGLFFILVRFGFIDYLNAFFDHGGFPDSVTRASSGRMAAHGSIVEKTTMGYHFMMMVFTPLMLTFFAIAIYSSIKRFRKPTFARYQEIGIFQLSRQACKVELADGSESWEASYDSIQRIDCFFGMGVMPQSRKQESTYDNIQVIRVQFLRNGERASYYILNNERGDLETGFLTHAFNVLKKSNLQYHRKIQFWEKY